MDPERSGLIRYDSKEGNKPQNDAEIRENSIPSRNMCLCS
jgi:hypothetical protein